MKKRPRGRRDELKPVKVFFDEIEMVVAALQEVSDRVEISTEDYVLDSADELLKLEQETIHSLSIHGYDAYITVDLLPRSVIISMAILG